MNAFHDWFCAKRSTSSVSCGTEASPKRRTLLGKSIDCPFVFASPNHDNLGFLRPRCPVVPDGNGKQGDGENAYRPASHSLSARNFISGVGARREENFQAIFGAVLLGVVGQHQQPGFVVLVLPCRRNDSPSQRGDIASIGNATCVRGSMRFGGGKRRLGLRVGRYGQDPAQAQTRTGRQETFRTAGGGVERSPWRYDFKIH